MIKLITVIVALRIRMTVIGNMHGQKHYLLPLLICNKLDFCSNFVASGNSDTIS